MANPIGVAPSLSLSPRTEQQCIPSSYKAEEHIQVVVVNDSYLPSSLQPYPTTKTTTTTTTTTVRFQEPLLPISTQKPGVSQQSIALAKALSLPSTTRAGAMVPSNPGGESGKVPQPHISVPESPFLENEGGEVGCGEVVTAGSGVLGLQRTRSAPSSSLEGESLVLPLGSDGEEGRGGVRKEKEVEGLACGAAADIGQRGSMEDTHLAERDLGRIGGPGVPAVRALVGVFDGHNGAGAAEFAAENFVGFMEGDWGCMEDVMDGAFRRWGVFKMCWLCGCVDGISRCGMNRKVNMHTLLNLGAIYSRCEAELLKRMEDGVAGTTALIAAVAENTLHIANLGDCRAVLCRDSRATQVYLSCTHLYAENA